MHPPTNAAANALLLDAPLRWRRWYNCHQTASSLSASLPLCNWHLCRATPGYRPSLVKHAEETPLNPVTIQIKALSADHTATSGHDRQTTAVWCLLRNGPNDSDSVRRNTVDIVARTPRVQAEMVGSMTPLQSRSVGRSNGCNF